MRSKFPLLNLAVLALGGVSLSGSPLARAAASTYNNWIPIQDELNKFFTAKGRTDMAAKYGQIDTRNRIGQEMWFNATVGNKRYHTYATAQRLGAPMEWDTV